MEALSIFNVPKYQQKKLFDSVIGCSIDYKRFNIRDRKLMEGLLVSSHQADNITNTNVAYDGNIAYLRISSPRGVAHQIIASFEEVGAVPFAYVEIYGKGQGLKGSIGRIDFYGAFFHFFDDLPQRYKNLYNHLMQLSKKDDKKVIVTRIDVAIDCNYTFPQKGYNWFNPCKLSKREVELYRHNGLFNSFGYLSDRNRGYGVRMYDKNVQAKKRSKESWYGGADKMPENWTRIEYEFYDPYCKYDESKLVDMVIEKILGKKISLGMSMRPTYTFNIENAYNYFARYAKNHGISFEKLIEELVNYHMYLQEKKEIYGLIEENI